MTDNGGATATHALLPGSPAIDAGNNGGCLATDQRGITRIQGSRCDIGAYELFDCTAQPYLVGVEAELNDAIGSFNAATDAGKCTISFTDDINLTAATTTINNATAGIDLQIEGNGYLLDGQNEVRLFNIASNTTVSIDTLTMQNGLGDSGGAINSQGHLTIENSTVRASSADDGGGIYNFGTLTINGSTLSDNSANVGGGIASEGGTLTVNNSTVSNNSADYVGGGIVNAGIATVNNSTLNGNSAEFGGGIYIYNFGDTLEMSNNIIANNVDGGDCVNNNGVFNINVNNLIADNSCNPALSGDPNLGALQDNGGATHTHLPAFNSLAIDAGDNATCLATDQRGEGRDDLNCDIGAVEVTFADTSVVEKTLAMGDGFTFGPTYVSITDTTNARVVGTATVTKTLMPPPDLFGDSIISATWEIEATGSPYSATLTICYLDSELPTGTDESGLQLFRSTAPNEWVGMVSSADSATNCITTENVTAFSRWAIAAPDATSVTMQTAIADVVGIGRSAILLLVIGLLWLTRRVVQKTARTK